MTLPLLRRGKVRDLYRDGPDLILVASDRVSVYDVVLPTAIPDKGTILTRLTTWWFDQLADLIPNHVVSTTNVPDQWAGRAVRCRDLAMLPVECVIRGHLTGSAWVEYQRTGQVAGTGLPAGLTEGAQLPAPLFTPTTKADGGHDEPITFGQLTTMLGSAAAFNLRNVSMRLFARMCTVAAARGILIADTKLEFGIGPAGTLILADEVGTPDSSRFWPAAGWRTGRRPVGYDKQIVRDWADGSGWDRQPPGPPIPAAVVDQVRNTYIEVCERLTGLPSGLDRR